MFVINFFHISLVLKWRKDKKNRFEAEVKSIKAKMDSISGVYDDLNEKMHDVDKTM